MILKRSEKELNDALAEMTMNEKTAAAIQRYIDAYSMAIDGLLKQVGVADTDVGKMEPLTLEELLKMDGEPVWIKLFDQDEEFWVLRNEWVDTRNPEPMILFHMRWYSHADYGKTWLSFRQKPEEGTR